MTSRDDYTNAYERLFGKDFETKPAEGVAIETRSREDTLREALKLTMGDRNETYGDPSDNHQNIAAMWNTYISIRNLGIPVRLDPEDVAMLMALMKITRIAQRNTRAVDSFVDAAAYIAIADECRARESAYDDTNK